MVCRTRVLGIDADAGAARSGFGGAMRTTVDAFVSIKVGPRCFLSFTVALADTESLCLEVPSHEEVEEVWQLPYCSGWRRCPILCVGHSVRRGPGARGEARILGQVYRSFEMSVCSG